MQLPFPQFLPESKWVPPNLSDLPDLSSAKLIGYDLETYDPKLKIRGPGGVRNDGFVVGYCLATSDGFKVYLPIRHAGGNLPLDAVQRYVSDQLGRADQPKVTSHGSYEREWSDQSKVTLKGVIYDTEFAECLLNEEKFTYSLESLANEYLGEKKEEELMREAAWFYGESAKSIMHLLHSKHVGLYAENDPDKSLRVFEKQAVKLKDAGLWPLFQLESELSEVFWLMRKKGVPFNQDRCEQLIKVYRKEEQIIYASLKTQYFPSRNIDFNSAKDLASVCESHGITDYPRTAKGNPSFIGDWMDLQEWGFFQGVSKFRTIEKLRRDFLEGSFLQSLHKGRIHAQFNQLRGDDGGTRSGRISMCDPNLQQVPSRSEYAKDIRDCFTSETGEDWIKGDYSQQEYRIFVHFCMLMKMEGAKEAGDIFINDLEADFHRGIADMLGWEGKQGRTDAKNWNFAAIYGAGIAKTAKMTKKTLDEATKLNTIYHEKVPYAKPMSKDCSMRASQRGWIKTLGGRILHFETYEPAWNEDNAQGLVKALPLPFAMAQKKWPGQRLRRGQTHKALNRLVQGSAADMMKIAMLNLYKKHKIVPLLQVHDELDHSGDLKVALLMKQEMENAIKLLVPVVADFAMGKSWGYTEKIKL